jgi:hypothetical protein
MQVHSATLESGVLSDAGVLEALGRLRRKRGWRVGLSLSGAAQAKTLRVAMACLTASGDKASLLFVKCD